jgi:hypothetical protein
MKLILLIPLLFITSCAVRPTPDQIQSGADIAKLLIQIIPEK